MRVRSHVWLAVVGLFAPAAAHAQSTFTWDPAGIIPNWTGPANWTGGPAGTYPGVPNGGGNAAGSDNDLAVIGTFAFSAGNGLAINFDTVNGSLLTDGLLSLGGIDFTSTTANTQIGNPSPSVNGVLQLNGATVNGVAYTLIAVRGTRNLTVANVPTAGGSGSQTMRLDLGIANGVFLVTTGRTLTISSVIGETAAGHGFTARGGGTVRLLGTNAYTGTTTVAAGTTVQVGNAGTAGTLGTGAVVNNGTLTFNRSALVTVANNISGTGTLNTGAPGITLTGILAPGNSIGTMTATGTVNLGSGGTFRAELGAGTSSDQLNLSGGANTLNLANGSTVNLVASGFTRTGTPATFTLAVLQGTGASLLQLNGVNAAPGTVISTFTANGLGGGSFVTNNGSVTLTATGFSSLLNGDKLTLQRSSGGDLVLTFTPVPEPGTILGVCALAVGGVTAVRRWRNKRSNGDLWV